MKKNILTLLLALTFSCMGVHANAQKDPMVGGAAMYPRKNIVENAVNSKDHTTLAKILTCYVVPGRLTIGDLKKMIKQGDGKAELKTVQGGTLTLAMKDGKYMLTDEKGGMATITIHNVIQSNGVIQVINAVLMPH